MRGTPLILKGPVTSNNPDLSYFKKTTLLPLNLPARTMRTYPAWMFLANLVYLGALPLLLKCVFTSSPAYHFGIYLKDFKDIYIEI